MTISTPYEKNKKAFEGIAAYTIGYRGHAPSALLLVREKGATTYARVTTPGGACCPTWGQDETAKADEMIRGGLRDCGGEIGEIARLYLSRTGDGVTWDAELASHNIAVMQIGAE